MNQDIQRWIIEAGDQTLKFALRHRAFGALIRHHEDIAYGCAYALLKDFGRAEEAVQDAFLIAWQQMENLRDPAAFAGWLRQIVVHQCHRILRVRGITTTTLEIAVEVSSPEPGPDEQLEMKDRQKLVQSALEILSDQHRLVISLFYLAGYTAPEIARLLDISAATVRKRLQYARKALKGQLLTMINNLFDENRLSQDETFVNGVMARIKTINDWADQYRSLSDEAIPAETAVLRQRIVQGGTMEDILPAAFGLVKEVCRRLAGDTWKVDGEEVTFPSCTR